MLSAFQAGSSHWSVWNALHEKYCSCVISVLFIYIHSANRKTYSELYSIKADKKTNAKLLKRKNKFYYCSYRLTLLDVYCTLRVPIQPLAAIRNKTTIGNTLLRPQRLYNNNSIYELMCIVCLERLSFMCLIKKLWRHVQSREWHGNCCRNITMGRNWHLATVIPR